MSGIPNMFDIERHIIPVEEGMKIANEKAIEAFNSSSSDGTPTAFALYEGKLYVIWTAGQGPGLAYAEQWYEDRFWKIDVSGWGTLYAIGTEKQAEEWRRHKADWEGGSARKMEVDKSASTEWEQLSELLG